MKTKPPKKPAAKPAKTPKPTPAPRIVRHEPEPERAEVAAARAIIQAVDEAEARAMLAGGSWPFALPPVPADFAAAVRPLLAAARLPAGSLPPTVARFAALVEEWERTSSPVAWEAWRKLCRREFGWDWDAYRRAELARVSARVTADALQVLRRLSPKAARAAAEETRPRFADAGAAVLEYLAAPLPGMDADEDTASPRVFLSRIEDALAALADAARNPATPPASRSNAADAETVARTKHADATNAETKMVRAFSTVKFSAKEKTGYGLPDARKVKWEVIVTRFEQWAATPSAKLPKGFPVRASEVRAALERIFRAVTDSARNSTR